MAYRRSRRYSRRRRNPFKVIPRICYDSQIARCTYNTSFSPVSSGIGVSQTTFSASSPYDPEVTGIGTRATGLRDWMAFYVDGIVLQSRIRVNLVRVNSGTVPAVRWGVITQNDLTPANTSQFVNTMQKNSKWRDHSIFAGKTSLESVYKPENYWAGQPSDNDSLYFSYTSNPADQTYWVLWLQPTDSFTALASERMYFVINIDYIIKFSNPKTVINPS